MSLFSDFILDPPARTVESVVDETVYPLEAVYGACYLFIDRCYVFLDRQEGTRIRVVLKARGETTEEGLAALVGSFANELLNQALRHRIGESNGRIREYIMAKAFFSADQQSTIDKLLAELDAEELAGDPLEIPIPWEQKP